MAKLRIDLNSPDLPIGTLRDLSLDAPTGTILAQKLKNLFSRLGSGNLPDSIATIKTIETYNVTVPTRAVVSAASPHGLNQEESIFVFGSSGSGVDGTRVILTTLNPNIFIIPALTSVSPQTINYVRSSQYRATNATVPGVGDLATVTSTAHGLSTGNQIRVLSSTTTPALSGDQIVTVIDADTFTIDGSSITAGGNVAYALTSNLVLSRSLTNSQYMTINIPSHGFVNDNFNGTLIDVTGSDIQVLGSTLGIRQYRVIDANNIILLSTSTVGGTADIARQTSTYNV